MDVRGSGRKLAKGLVNLKLGTCVWEIGNKRSRCPKICGAESVGPAHVNMGGKSKWTLEKKRIYGKLLTKYSKSG